MLTQLEKKFQLVSDFVSRIVGSPVWFFFSLMVVIVWVPSRFLFGSDELWHLFINTFTTILTFLMMSLLHASQSKWERKMEKMEQIQGGLLKNLENKTELIETLEKQIEKEM